LIEIPKNECEGCADRDRIIEILAERVDELSEQPLGISNSESQLSNSEFCWPPDMTHRLRNDGR